MPHHFPYEGRDVERRLHEGPKTADLVAHRDHRSAFGRDRARVLHSAALRRLADKTQVVEPGDGDTPRTRLTHSLEVAQIARGIGASLGLDPDLSEMAGLTHDIGHPPYGHNGEHALNELAVGCGGFEGNAQTLRILTRLEPKVLDARGNSFGLNLTRAALDAACKYPWTKTRPDGTTNLKYGCYDEDAEVLRWMREGHAEASLQRSMEAQVMDFSDDIAYSVHDVEDGIIAGNVRLGVLWDFVELAELAQKGAQVFGGDPDAMVEAAARLRGIEVVEHAANFDASLRGFAALKAMTSQLVGRYVGATVEATKAAAATAAAPGEVPLLGRTHGTFVVPPEVLAEVTLLKTMAVLYVMDDPKHLARQDRQRERMASVHEYLLAGAPGSLDPMFRTWWQAADTDAARHRVVIDQLASMTETRLEREARYAGGISCHLA